MFLGRQHWQGWGAAWHLICLLLMPPELVGETTLLCTERRYIELGLVGQVYNLSYQGSQGRSITSSRLPEL